MYRDRPLSVVASLDCAALRDHVLPGLSLPHEGTLTYFYDVAEQSTWGFDPADRGSWRVVHAVGGGPADVQGPMWLGAQLASSGLYVGGPEGYRDPRDGWFELQCS